MNRRYLPSGLVRACLLPGLLVIGACAAQPGRSRLSPTVSPVAEPAARVSAITTPDRYIEHIAFLAHDQLGGRGTGSDGIDLAAGYIAGRFAAAGVKPGGPNGTYFQDFEVERRAELLPETRLTIEGCDAAATLSRDFVPFAFSSKGDFAGELVFVGYGITNPDREYDDYGGVDVKGRVVLMLRREPARWSDAGEPGDHARFDSKVRLAAKSGAVAVLVVNQDPGVDGVDGLMRFRPQGETHGLPALHVKRALADQLLAASGMATLTALQQKIEDDGRAVSAPLLGIRVSGTVAYEARPLAARNVIGVLPGSGPNADKHIVIGAHYDHLGTTRGRIHNGADDNASGTAALLELARSLAETPRRDRSVVLIAFSAEEMGLLGSEHFVAEPTVPLDSISAMINMDMVGRLNNDDEANRLGIQGLGTGDVFQKIVARRAAEAGLPFLPDQSAKGPSDHASFYEAGIPSLFFFTGVHLDYHQPGDDVEKINAAGGAQVTDLVHRIALDLINREEAVQFAEVDAPAQIFRGASSMGSGVVMGIMPDMDDESEQPGWRVGEVLPGGGAAKAGIRSGDRILRIGGEVVNDLGDYRKATADKKPGDMIDVTVLRGRDELTLAVELSSRGGRTPPPTGGTP